MPSSSNHKKRVRTPSSSNSQSSSSNSGDNQEREDHLQQAAACIAAGELSMGEAISKFKVRYGTLHHQVQGSHQSARDGHEKEQLLSNIKQQVLVDWCRHQSHMGDALSHVQVAQKATELAGRVPGKKWVAWFPSKDQTAILTAKGHGLDPLHAQAFNLTTVKDHFKQLAAVIEEYRVPPQQYL
ncbi:hypothetical protein K439DRAFT_1616526 [Ramaria rubella]|nr:hypothetical protein K439DRAFT_1616526 [Ramaria rubella]